MRSRRRARTLASALDHTEVRRMYGTVMRFTIAPGREDEALALFSEFKANPPEGFVDSWIYRLDAGDGQFVIAAVHTSRAAYAENAQRPAQNEWFGRFRELLTGDVSWSDGDLVAVEATPSLAR